MHYSIEKKALITFLRGRQSAPCRVSFQCKESKTTKNLLEPWDLHEFGAGMVPGFPVWHSAEPNPERTEEYAV
jgi:hypothetical protein